MKYTFSCRAIIWLKTHRSVLLSNKNPPRYFLVFFTCCECCRARKREKKMRFRNIEQQLTTIQHPVCTLKNSSVNFMFLPATPQTKCVLNDMIIYRNHQPQTTWFSCSPLSLSPLCGRRLRFGASLNSRSERNLVPDAFPTVFSS